MSPFKLMYGTDPVAIPTAIPRTSAPAVDKRLEEIKNFREEALAAHELNKQRMAQRITRRSKPFKLGDKVWLSAKNLSIKGPVKKFAPKKVGPLEITKIMGPVTYQLKLPSQWKIHNVFHASLLSAYRENDFHGPNYPEPPPDILNEEEEWEVEAIINHKGTGNRRRYFIRWKGYPSSENTWEPEKYLKHARTILNNYKKRHKL